MSVIHLTSTQPLRRPSLLRNTTSGPPDGLRLRARARSVLVRLRRGALDRAIAGGKDPAGDPALSLRATQLTATRTRRRLAEDLLEATVAADVLPRAGSATVPLARDAIIACGPALRRLAQGLLEVDRVTPQAVVLTRQLLTDGASPLFAPATADELSATILEAEQALRS